MSPEKRVLDDETSEQEAKKLKEELKEENIENAEDADDDVEDEEAPPAKKKITEESGVLLFGGSMQFNIIGRKTNQSIPAQTHYTPKRVKAMADVRVSRVISHSSCAHAIILSEEGEVYMLGRNEKGQLGFGDTKERAGFNKLDKFEDTVIINGACGRNFTLFLTEDGDVYSCGDNKNGQCGLGHTNAVLTPTKIDFKDGKIKKVACGGEFSMILTEAGELYSFGLPEYGQLGHNTDGKFFVSASKLSYHFETSPKRVPVFVEILKGQQPTPIRDVVITDVACGNNHTVALDSKKRLFSWGFGGYGRLGHSDPKDQQVPRLIKFFDRTNGDCHQVYCGSSFTIAMSNLGVFQWGQTKRTGEANMYPKPIQDLYGWNVRSVGCSNTSIVLAADDTVIAWGPSPTYGELGFGEHMKSSTTPKEVKALDGAHVLQVACSMGFTLQVCRDSTEDDKTILSKLKEITN